jgi:CPA2 family monovalent cation:H+ antiporter-2
MMLMLATLSVPFHLAKQTKIIAMIIVGVIFGPVLHLEEQMRLSLATMSSLFDIGILLTLFCGGMVVDVGVLKRHWNLVLINGLGQILLNWGLFIGLGAALFSKKTNFMGVLYFGFCCQLSSPIVMERCLHKRGELHTLHGQIVLGRLLFQDVGAVLAMALLPAVADQTIVDSASTAKSFSVGWIFVWLAVLLVFVYLLYRFVLRTLFRYCAVSSDLLFVAVYAYSFGVAAVFGWFLPTINGTGFSQEIGIFFAGVSIGALEYRLQIQAFVDPVKEFGLLLFFFILGITLPIRDTTTLSESLLQGLLIAVLIVFVCPSLMWLTGAMSGLNSRCSFMLGNTVNQVGEFALILANFAKALGIFTDAMYVTVVVSFFLSIVLSSMCHEYADPLYTKLFKRLLSSLDAWCRVKEEHTHDFPMQDHVVLLGYNAIALAIAEYYRSVGQDVLLVQLDPKIHHGLRDLYKRGLAEQTAEKNKKTGAPPASHTGGSERSSRGGEVRGRGGGTVTREQARLPVREVLPERVGTQSKAYTHTHTHTHTNTHTHTHTHTRGWGGRGGR